MVPDLMTLTLTDAIDKLKDHEFSALELTEACLRQIEKLNPVMDAFITPTPEPACQAALAVDGLISLNPSNLDLVPLPGLPMAFKDLFDTSGILTTAGSKFFSNNIPNEDAQAVLKVKLAGAVPIGKTNLHEIALGTTGINPYYGSVRNPWDHSRISGGSSSGSAAAVSAGMCLAALGTDTGGSIRIPASFCGVVGLKPTRGLVSTRGVIPLSFNLDHVGPMTKTVRDAALMLSVLAGFDPHDPSSIDVPTNDYLSQLEKGVKGWQIAMVDGDYLASTDNEVMQLVKDAARVFIDLGAKVEPLEMEWLGDMAKANSQITQADAAAYHRDRLIEHPDWFGEDVRQRLETGKALTSTEYSLARQTQDQGRRRLEMLFTKYDLLLLPTTPVIAPRIEGINGVEAASLLTRFTAPFNLAGVPAISIPCGFTRGGLPVGLQLVTKALGDAILLQAGYAYEIVTGWGSRHPDS